MLFSWPQRHSIIIIIIIIIIARQLHEVHISKAGCWLINMLIYIRHLKILPTLQRTKVFN